VKGVLQDGNTRNMLIVLHAGAEGAFSSSEWRLPGPEEQLQFLKVDERKINPKHTTQVSGCV
jgi:hypothetical protein